MNGGREYLPAVGDGKCCIFFGYLLSFEGFFFRKTEKSVPRLYLSDLTVVQDLV